jgi:hypothetical protein
MELERYYDHDLFNKKWTSFYKIWRPLYKFSKKIQVFVMPITFTSIVSIVYGNFWVDIFWVNVSSMWIVARVLGCNGAVSDVAMNCNLVLNF